MVALIAPAIKVDIVGTRVGAEEWNTGFWVTAPSPTTQLDLDTWLTGVQGFVNTWWAAVLSRASAGTAPSAVRARWYEGGDLTATLSAERPLTTTPGSSGTTHPYQVSVVASLRTSVPSRTTRGRMYLPLDGTLMSTGGQYAAAAITAVNTPTATLLTSVNGTTIGGLPTTVVVASHVTGLVQYVTRVVMDTIPDIQRRRANALLAASVSSITV